MALDARMAAELAAAHSQGTTALTAMVGAHKIVLGNTGDSRAVICRAGKSLQISSDQTVTEGLQGRAGQSAALLSPGRA